VDVALNAQALLHSVVERRAAPDSQAASRRRWRPESVASEQSRQPDLLPERARLGVRGRFAATDGGAVTCDETIARRRWRLPHVAARRSRLQERRRSREARPPISSSNSDRIPDANVADWPLTYPELAPFYDAVEERLGVQGDIHQIPAHVLSQAPRDHQFVLPPTLRSTAARSLAEGARKLGYHPYPVAMASTPAVSAATPLYSCGFCSGFGCPINARRRRGDLLPARAFARGGAPEGAVLRPPRRPGSRRAARDRRVLSRRAGRHRTQRADPRDPRALGHRDPRLLLSLGDEDHPHGVGNRSGPARAQPHVPLLHPGLRAVRAGLHAWRGPSTTITIDDCRRAGLPPAAKQAGLPYSRAASARPAAR